MSQRKSPGLHPICLYGNQVTIMLWEKYTKAFLSTLPTSWLLQVAFVFSGTPAAAIPVLAPIPPPIKATQSTLTKPQPINPRKIQQPTAPTTPAKNHLPLTISENKKQPVTADQPKSLHKRLSGLSVRQLTPGLVYRNSRGKQLINVLDLDLSAAHLQVVPVLASNTFDRLEQVKQQAQKVKALAAINANYFKLDGTPLGALVKDGEWIAGPIYQRTAIGITADGRVLVDKVSLIGTLESSNPGVGLLTIGSINQPRIHGSKIVVYTQRWGNVVRMPYAGVLVAVDSNCQVVNKTSKTLAIPQGGFVLSDKKGSLVSRLQVGDVVHISWRVTPEPWGEVVQAVSGGPVLLHNGKIAIDCQSEKFPASWSGTAIKARTVIGVTRNHHIIMATLEGKHTLYDAARLLQSLGAYDALNLDGGGSTTMVVAGQTVTRNRRGPQRCVAAALAILDEHAMSACQQKTTLVPSSNHVDLANKVTSDNVLVAKTSCKSH